VNNELAELAKLKMGVADLKKHIGRELLSVIRPYDEGSYEQSIPWTTQDPPAKSIQHVMGGLLELMKQREANAYARGIVDGKRSAGFIPMEEQDGKSNLF